MKGQTWIEFIVATSVFLLSIGFIFMSATGNFKEEIQKTQQQTSCLQAYALESFLKSPGTPANWDSSTGFSVFGLSNGTNKPYIISNDKWLAMKNFGFVNVSQNSTPSQSWNIGYSVYGFRFNTSNLDSTCLYGNATTICRTQTTGFGPYTKYLTITANSTQQSKTKLKLFFPFGNLAISGTPTNETNDLISFSSTTNGTYANIQFNTNSTDEDSVVLTPSTGGGEFPPFVFIQQRDVESGQYLPVYLGNTTIQDNFGATPPPNALVCTTRVNGLLNTTNETLLANFELKAW